MCPSGSAPVSYRMYEALQMGSVPVYVHDERGAFLPYKDTQADIRHGMGWVVTFGNMLAFMNDTVTGLSRHTIRQMRSRIIRFRTSHFTPAGVARQLRGWLRA